METHHIDCCAEARWIASESGFPVDLVHSVLLYDLRYMVALGLAHSPDGDLEVEDHEVRGLS